MAKHNKSNFQNEAALENFSSSYWKYRLENEILLEPKIKPDNLNEQEIWKNALFVEMLIRSRSK